MEDTNLTWLLSAIGAVGIGALIAWLIKRIENKDKEERNRVKSIADEKSYYGEAFSQWLIKNKIDIYEPRIHHLLGKVNEWGSKRVQELIEMDTDCYDTNHKATEAQVGYMNLRWQETIDNYQDGSDFIDEQFEYV